LSIAKKAIEQFQLNRVLFIPAAQSPLKTNSPAASDEDRLEMIRLAIGDNPSFEVSTAEIERGGVSYSIETAQRVACQNPGAKLFWIIGGDQAKQLDRWRNIEELAQKVEFIYLERDEQTSLPEVVSSLTKLHPLQMERIPTSSTEIRNRAKSGDLPKYFLPEPVFHYIKSRNLYRDELTTP
jgi:nicotinate-nucleotide adenylyltransferase